MSGWMSVSSRSTGLTGSYTPKSFHSANVKEVYLEEWLRNVAKANLPDMQTDTTHRCRLGEADSAHEMIVLIDSVVEHQRRSPWVTWGEFPLFPVGDPPPLSALHSRVC